MKIKIIKGEWWYKGKEGQIFDNYNLIGDWYIEGNGEHSVLKSHAEVVEDNGFVKGTEQKLCHKCLYGVQNGNCIYPLSCINKDKWVSKEEIINNRKSVAGKFETVGSKLGALLDEKRKAYGNGATTAGEILKILYPNGVSINQYQDMLLMVRVLDKLCRIANDKDSLGENPWMDIAGYGMLGSKES